jgi:TfoX/Sxy family transcriptional regulator of competence genes
VAFDEKLAVRIRATLEGQSGIVEKRMFGGLAFLFRGHMCCGIVGEDLMVRVGPDGHERALAEPHARPMDFTGKPLKGMVYVASEGVSTAKALRTWIDRGLEHARTLPPKDRAAPRQKDTKRSRGRSRAK